MIITCFLSHHNHNGFGTAPIKMKAESSNGWLQTTPLSNPSESTMNKNCLDGKIFQRVYFVKIVINKGEKILGIIYFN